MSVKLNGGPIVGQPWPAKTPTTGEKGMISVTLAPNAPVKERVHMPLGQPVDTVLLTKGALDFNPEKAYRKKCSRCSRDTNVLTDRFCISCGQELTRETVIPARQLAEFADAHECVNTQRCPVGRIPPRHMRRVVFGISLPFHKRVIPKFCQSCGAKAIYDFS